MSFCYEDIKTYAYGAEYLNTQPTKRNALDSASIDGKVTILPNSNNRAITIETDKDVYLQSYDTLILRKNKKTGKIDKLWDEYTKTTLKHINEFLGTNMGKAQWLAYEGN